MKKSKDLIRKYDSEDISPQWISKACSVTLTYTRLYLYATYSPGLCYSFTSARQSHIQMHAVSEY